MQHGGGGGGGGPMTPTLDSKKRKLEGEEGEGGSRKSLISAGPCFLKLLVPNIVAGSIIGKQGSVITQIEQQTGCCMKLSPSNSFFPNTSDRIVIMGGQQEHINAGLCVVLEKLNDACSAESSVDGRLVCKVVVPKSTVSCIIGKQGAQIKQLQEQTNARIQISSREEHLQERVVNISGTLDTVRQAALQVAETIQGDSNLATHLHVLYSNAGSGSAPAPPPQTPPPQNMGGYSYSNSPQPYGHQQYGGGYQQMGYHNNDMHSWGNTASMPPEVMSNPCEIEMQVADALVGFVLGARGIHLQEVQQSSGARIQMTQKGELVPGTQNRRVTIIGSVNSVHMAHVLLLQKVYEAQSQQAKQGQQHPQHQQPMNQMPPQMQMNQMPQQMGQMPMGHMGQMNQMGGQMHHMSPGGYPPPQMQHVQGQ